MIIGFNDQYRFLSNFYPSRITFEGLVYPTVEHAYQAAKTEEPEVRRHIQEKATAIQAKIFGRELQLREDWEDIKLPIMRTLLRKKFYDPVLRAALIATNSDNLVETNYWHDNFWGSCTCNKCRNKGANWLGELLVELRCELQGDDIARS